MVLAEMRGGIPNSARMVHDSNIHEGQLGVEYLNEFNLELCGNLENVRNGDEFSDYQRQRKAIAYLHHQQQAQQQQQQQHLMSHHQLQNAAGSGGSEEGLGGAQQPHPPHHIIPDTGNNVATSGIIYASNDEAMSIPNGNARHQLQIVKIMSPCSPPENQSPTHCPQLPSPDYRNMALEARTPLMASGPDQGHHDQGHLNRNIPMWMDGMPVNGGGGIPPMRCYEKPRYQDPLDLSSVGSESLEDGGHWIQRKQEYGNCVDSPQLYMAEGHTSLRTYSRNQSSEGRRTPHLPNPGGISDKDLLNLAVRDLNKLLHGLDRAEIQRIKQKRRTLKNRGYAQNCRMKRVDQRRALEEENRRIRKDYQRLNEHCANLRAENLYLKETLQGLTACKQQRKYEMPPRRPLPPQINNNSNIVNNNLVHPGGGASNNGGGVVPSHLNGKGLEYPEPLMPLQPTQPQPIVSSTVKDVRSDGVQPHGNQATPHPDSPEPSNCYWKEQR